MRPNGPITELLHASREEHRAAEWQLIPFVYNELRRLAGKYMHSERLDHTLQSTALVHEAYLRQLIGQESDLRSRTHFLGVAAHRMPRDLVYHARKQEASKRAGGESRVTFEDDLAVATYKPHELVTLDQAVEKLAKEYPRQARVVELRFFGGYTEDEMAEILSVSPQRVKRDWRFARTWLSQEIHQG
jgi:RNA polymerase sigma factor (TIGR02999 family)